MNRVKVLVFAFAAVALTVIPPAGARTTTPAHAAVLHGIYYSPVYKNGAKVGYATLVMNAGKLVHFERFDRFSAPYEVQRQAESASSYGVPNTTVVGEDSRNIYYYTTYPNGTWTHYAVNK